MNKMRNLKNIFSLLVFSIFMTGCAPTVQKRIMVTTNLRSTSCNEFGCGSYLDFGDNAKRLSKECIKFSVYQDQLDALLRNGAKIISARNVERSTNWRDESNRTLKGSCIGSEYIIEATQSQFDRYLK